MKLSKFTNKTVMVATLAIASIAGVALVSSNVFASLNATAFNTSAQTVSAGTLKLTQAADSSFTAGFTTSITNVAPGDQYNRFINLTNGGTLAGSSTTLKLADAFNPYTSAIASISASAGVVTYTTSAAHSFVAGQTVSISGATTGAYNLTNVTIASTPSSTTFTVASTATGATSTATATALSTLTSDATNGLQVTVSACSVAWTAVTAACSGSTTTPLAKIAASSLISSAQTLTLPAAAFNAGGVAFLKFTLDVPAGSETTVNGVLPATTIQGASAGLTWTFTEAQRTATSPNNA